jgi:DNA polymerase I
MKKAVLIDGHGLIHRAFHALPGLTTQNGRPINAVYGFSLILLNALKELKPDYAAVSFDLAKPTFRHRAYKEYKGKRRKTPVDLAKQIPLVKKVVKTLNIPIFEARGYEADDLIGTLAVKIADQYPKIKIIIVTGDLDILQLVNNRVSVYTMRRGLTQTTIYGPTEVRKRYRIPVKYLPDFKGLVGDQSDNIPGVAGIGQKTAQKLIEQQGGLEEIYQALDKGQLVASDRTVALLKKDRKMAFASRDLATIRCEVPIDFNLDQLLLADYNQEKVTKLFSKLEFKSLLNKLPLTDGYQKVSQTESTDYQLIENRSQLSQLKEKIRESGSVVIDTETSTLNGRLIGISFSYQAGRAFYLSFSGSSQENTKKTAFQPADIKDILEDKRIEKIGHGLKYDYRVLLANKVKLAGISFDTMIAGHLLDPEKRNYKLDRLAFNELGHQMIPLESLMGKDFSIPLDQVELTKVKDYSCEDADICYQLSQKFRPRLEKRNLTDLFQKIELPLIKILAKMEGLGVKIDSPQLEKLKDKTIDRLKEIDREIISLAGRKFNINSPQQLAEILFQKLAISQQGVRKTKTGASTAISELVKLIDRHPIISLIINHRQLEKLRNTYLEPLLEKPDQTGRVHTSFNQTITATGRLSSSEPNLQNIPTRTELGAEIRQAFISQTGFRLVSFDYSQIELRVAAHLSGDRRMIQAFNKGRDIHQSTAAELNNIPLSQVSHRQRQEAKTVNFAVLYGMSPYGLAQSLARPVDYAQEFIDNYFRHFSGVGKYLQQIKKEVAQKGYTETLFGRRRYFDIKGSRFSRNRLERAAINTPIQGTAADLIKKAMVEIDAKIGLVGRLSEKGPRLLLQVHDELIFEVANRQVKSLAKRVKEIMEKGAKLRVPLVVEVKTGQNWGNLKKLK